MQHQVKLEIASTRAIGEIMGLLLDEANRNDDVFVAKGLIGLLFTFEFNDEKGGKKLLYQLGTVCNGKIWKKVDFWDAAIFESTYE